MKKLLTYTLIIFISFTGCKKEEKKPSTTSSSSSSSSGTGGSGGGTSSCNDINFNTTTTYGTLTDIDGNTYKTIVIGSQEWMAENLRTSRYANGDSIPNVTDNNEWTNLNTGAFCWNNNDSATYECPYGKLYNWYAVVDTRNLCPTGWSVPHFYGDWIELTDHLGGFEVAGKMKEAGYDHWEMPNTDATNESGFTGLPGGQRYSSGAFVGGNDEGTWWSSQDGGNLGADEAYDFGLLYNYGTIVGSNLNTPINIYFLLNFLKSEKQRGGFRVLRRVL